MMIMNMATTSFKSTSGSVLVALVVVLVAVMVAETSAQVANVTFVNELDAPLTVTVPATALGGPQTTFTIAPRKDGVVPVQVQTTLLAPSFDFTVLNCTYTTAGSAQGRVTANTGTVKFYVTGHCGTGVPGLQFLSSIEGDVCTNLGCAAPVNSTCNAGPIS